MRPRRCAVLSWPCPLAAIALLAACIRPSPTMFVTPPVTPTFTSLPTPASTATPPLTLLPTATPPPTAEPGPLPALLARIPLTPTDGTLQDLLLDHAMGRVYVTDTAGQLHVLDAETYAELATLPARGNLTLDAARERLYVWDEIAYDNQGSVTVVDTASLSVVGVVSPGGHVAIDNSRNRFYVGSQIRHAQDEGDPGVCAYDGATLEKLGEASQPGIPVYNPLRDELYIVAYTVYRADPETLEMTGDLLPEITAAGCHWCEGVQRAASVSVLPEYNLLIITMGVYGRHPGPSTRLFFNATTLERLFFLPETSVWPRSQDIWVQDRVYQVKHSGYEYYAVNLFIYDRDGALLVWYDGLEPGTINPRTSQSYTDTYYGGDLMVLDLVALSPLGTIPITRIHTLDAETGRIYGWRGNDLVILAERGSWPGPPPVGDAGPLPAEVVCLIQPSPNYAADRTLFLGAGDTAFWVGTYKIVTGDDVEAHKLYRSTDGGRTWAQLRGGLAEGDAYLDFDLAISPDYAADRTLFVGGLHSYYYRGDGVYRSTDGGDTWQPMWRGLTHLRVYDVALSPDYAADGALLAYANYERSIAPLDWGQSLFRSADRGLSWTMVITTTGGAALPLPETILPPGPPRPALQFRTVSYGQGVERTTDGGQTWQPVIVSRQPDFRVRAILSSANVDADRTVYILSEFDLFRSTDGGDTWQRWLDDRLAGRDYSRRLTAGAMSPPLDGGRHQLFIGTAVGEFWTLDPTALDWEPVAQPTPAAFIPTPRARWPSDWAVPSILPCDLCAPGGKTLPCLLRICPFEGLSVREQH